MEGGSQKLDDCISVLSVSLGLSLCSLLQVGQALSYYPSDQDQFYAAKTGEDVLALRDFLSKLPDSSTLPIRGRDWKPDGTFSYL